MSADLHLHIATKKQLPQVKKYLQTEISMTDTSGKWIKGYEVYLVNGSWKKLQDIPDKTFNKISEKGKLKSKFIKLIYDEDLVMRTKSIWIGEVSWLKASLLEDKNTFIPKTVEKINKIAYETPLIDNKLILKIKKCFKLPNNTIKKGGVWKGKGYKISEPDLVVNFLKENIGKYIYPISW